MTKKITYKLQRRVFLIWQDIPNSEDIDIKKVNALQDIFFLAGTKTRVVTL